MSVYTKTGDKGKTGLYTGERVDKCCARVAAYGSVDEAGSALGLARAFCRRDDVRTKIFAVQKLLPLLMADLASLNQAPLIKAEHIETTEREMDALEGALPPLQEFLIPGQTQGGAFLDLARTVLRRAERSLVELAQTEPVHETDRILLNRLSDYCFLLMRWEEQ